MLMITRPVGVATGKSPGSNTDFITAVMEDGSVWYTNDPEGLWVEGQPLPGTQRWSTWPEEKNARKKQDLESSNLESDWGPDK